MREDGFRLRFTDWRNANELCRYRHFQRQKHGCSHASIRIGRHLTL
nr:MAG TPA: hypothetical protein [Caudoviricetes sp.]